MADANREFGLRWIAAWNTRDLDVILELYADDAEMVSAGIIRLGLDTSGRLKGKDRLRAYWSKALANVPNLHLELIDLYSSPDSVVVHFQSDRGHTNCEYLRLNGDGKIVQGSANSPIE